MNKLDKKKQKKDYEYLKKIAGTFLVSILYTFWSVKSNFTSHRQFEND